MSLREEVSADLKNALREKRTLDLSVLRMLQSAIRNREIDKRGKEELTDTEVIEVIGSEIKKRREAVSEYTKANRQDLADKERAEIDVLMQYMPKQMTEDEVRDEVKKAITETEAKSTKDLGKVMKVLMPRMKGKAEGGLVNKVVKEELERSETS